MPLTPAAQQDEELHTTNIPPAVPAAKPKRAYNRIWPEIRTLAALLVFEDGFTVGDAAILLHVNKETLNRNLAKLWSDRVGAARGAALRFVWDPARPRPKLVLPRNPGERPKIQWPASKRTPLIAPRVSAATGANQGKDEPHQKRAYAIVPPVIRELAAVLVFDERFTFADAAKILHVKPNTLTKQLQAMRKLLQKAAGKAAQ
ncbi:hypothetical protein Gpo141_00007294 [Globisporangium polare]